MVLVCGLVQHCLSGWSNKGQSTLPPPSSLDLRSSLHLKDSTGSQNQELEVRNRELLTVCQTKTVEFFVHSRHFDSL